MHYISTRGGASPLSFADVTLAGLARDGGLYVPEAWPSLSRADVAALAGRSYAEIAVHVMRPFVGGVVTDAALAGMAIEAYNSFRHPAVTPLVQLGPSLFVLELFHGPTLAFKDLAMQLLARLMDHVLAERGERISIIGATSGDTGGAAIEAFRGRDRADVFILYPHNRVSEVQRRMMTTAAEENVHAIAVEGTFDDCQNLVKTLFADQEFRDRVRMGAVNSINWARIAAQIAYYFAAAVALGAPDRKIGFTVPTGNFGDIFAGFAASRMGLPIDRLVIATNVNDILVRTLQTGHYELRGVEATTAPSMDIQVSSNFERLLFEVYDRKPGPVRAAMASLKEKGRFSIEDAALKSIRSQFSSLRADEEEIAATIRTWRKEAGYLADPHTAVGLAVAEKERRDFSNPMVVLATAHPAKFPDAVEKAAGVRPQLPDWLSDLPAKKERFVVLPADPSAIKEFVSARSRANQGVSA